MPARILVAEDDLDLRKVLKARLVGTGFEVIEAVDGKEAVECVRAQPPDLVILDNLMPRMNGVDACAEIKSDPATRVLPVILVTASPDLVEAPAGGGPVADRMFVKPYDHVELLNAIGDLLEERTTMSKRVLIIEDQAELGRLISARLRSAGYQAHLAPDGMTAIQSAQTNPPDLVILDLMLPAGGGLGVLKRLRMSVKTNTIPVLILTGVTDEAKRREVLAEGADAFLLKPYEPTALLAEVDRLVA